MTLSLHEAEVALARQSDPLIAWGVGCHPRFANHLRDFDPTRFRALAEQTALVGEIGLDSGSRAPIELQQRVFRQALEVLSGMPRIVSIHSYQACHQVLDALRECPPAVPVLHWWTGSAAETRDAVQLGCFFSIHSQVARQSKFRLHVPPERILLESDHGYADPPPAIPCRIEWVEYLVAQQYRMDACAVRRLTWDNFATLVRQTGTERLLPEGLVRR